MGLLHECFYEERQMEQINLTTYLRELLERLLVSFGLQDRVPAKVEGPQILIGLDVGTPLSRLAAEVIGNSCKHAFPGSGADRSPSRQKRSTGRFGSASWTTVSA
jgi:two-component sensor histidine kinase